MAHRSAWKKALLSSYGASLMAGSRESWLLFTNFLQESKNQIVALTGVNLQRMKKARFGYN